jgi:hypothetical protein
MASRARRASEDAATDPPFLAEPAAFLCPISDAHYARWCPLLRSREIVPHDPVVLRMFSRTHSLLPPPGRRATVGDGCDDDRHTRQISQRSCRIRLICDDPAWQYPLRPGNPPDIFAGSSDVFARGGPEVSQGYAVARSAGPLDSQDADSSVSLRHRSVRPASCSLSVDIALPDRHIDPDARPSGPALHRGRFRMRRPFRESMRCGGAGWDIASWRSKSSCSVNVPM